MKDIMPVLIYFTLKSLRYKIDCLSYYSLCYNNIILLRTSNCLLDMFNITNITC